LLAALNALHTNKKRRKTRLRGAPAPSDSPSVSDSELAVPVSDDSIVEDYENDPSCLYCIGRFSEDRSGEDQK